MNKRAEDNSRAQTFDRIVNQYSLLITKICYYYSDTLSDFKDLRQDVLINIWTGIDKLNDPSRITTWIYRVCFNTCISYRRRNKNRKKEVDIACLVETPMEEGFDAGRYNEMHALINRLKPDEKAIIMMWIDGTTYDEIAEVVGTNRNTIATRIKRIKEKLVKLSNQ